MPHPNPQQDEKCDPDQAHRRLSQQNRPFASFVATQQFSRFRREADIQRTALTEPDL
jgi:hypothetical protein